MLLEICPDMENELWQVSCEVIGKNTTFLLVIFYVMLALVRGLLEKLICVTKQVIESGCRVYL